MDPLEHTTWVPRRASITGPGGEVFFEQDGVEAPEAWSRMAVNVVAQKYFRGQPGSDNRESSIRLLIDRVSRTIARWGDEQAYFVDGESAETFRCELNHVLVNQMASFNSPVWFNVGLEESPQCSACFINRVDDEMASIFDLARTEGMLFKWGSGAGTNFSTLRSSRERLSGGGLASGPVSFMRGFDAFAGVIKSGGKTRRAAKMVILDAGHPDILEFISCKAREERKARDLIKAGYDAGIDGEAYGSVMFQNSNNSVRVTDELMADALAGRRWKLRAVTTGEVMETLPAAKILRTIAEAAHACGDPGIQFDSTINAWHTCPESDRINASNPCAEYMFIDDSACNLASLNLRGFQSEDGALDVIALRRAADLMILAQEIMVDRASYPTEQIADNSRRFRPLGLGYTNLGALLMSRGLPYDSDAGRAVAAAITAVIHGQACLTSARVAESRGPFEAFPDNRAACLSVMDRHRRQLGHIDSDYVSYELMSSARQIWDEVIERGAASGFRNAQLTALAPTGTISFMMDCDTTGIEPDVALVTYKKLVGGGALKIVNRAIDEALGHLGYTAEQAGAIIEHVRAHDTIEGAPGLREEHLSVFDCAMRPLRGERTIDASGHINMMAAVQPFLSGAISKTVNLPREATVEEVEQAYVQAWRLGLKAIAIYRDGCKQTQPLTASSEAARRRAPPGGPPVAVRNRLPDERRSITHKFSIGGHEGYITAGMYEGGQPGEIFIVMAKEGSTISGLMDSFASAISVALQHGVPLQVLVNKFSHTRFEPSGFSQHPQIGHAGSIMDYLFRWLKLRFMDGGALNGAATAAACCATVDPGSEAPPCPECGNITRRAGTCFLCTVCGTSTGCG